MARGVLAIIGNIGLLRGRQHEAGKQSDQNNGGLANLPHEGLHRLNTIGSA